MKSDVGALNTSKCVMARYHPNSVGTADPHGFKQNLTDHGVIRRGLL